MFVSLISYLGTAYRIANTTHEIVEIGKAVTERIRDKMNTSNYYCSCVLTNNGLLCDCKGENGNYIRFVFPRQAVTYFRGA